MIGEKCLVLGGRRGLDQENLRWSIGRIPEVSKRIKEAQVVFDRGQNNLDLMASLSSTNDEFLARPHLRDLLAAIVQVGLYDRHTRLYGEPKWYLGNTNGVSTIGVLTNLKSFEEMVQTSPCFLKLNSVHDLAWSQDGYLEGKTLAGSSMEEYGIFVQTVNGLESLPTASKDCYQLMRHLQQDQQVEQFVHLGPSSDFREDEIAKLQMFDIPLNDAITMDPILSSFWETA